MMWRYLVGAVAGVLLLGGGALLWRSTATAHQSLIPAAPSTRQASGEAGSDSSEPPSASEKTREEKRFSRYDHDKDGSVARAEYLAARTKAFARLDTNGDGRLSFDEWAIKATTKFAGADADRSGALTPVEFAATRVVRQNKAPVRCPPTDKGQEEES
jgi:hypothetical protein